MERITLYHRGVPITHHNLNDSSFSIGTCPRNDLVLAGTGISEQHLVLYRGEDQGWRARFGDAAPARDGELRLQQGTRLPLGPYTVEVNTISEGTISLKDAAGAGRGKAPEETKFIGDSADLNVLRLNINKLAPLRAPVLIQGDSGTGKELIARALHEQSNRSEGPLIAVNCGSLTPSLLEDTLFGHELGAYTGAARSRKGVFEQADGGTLFLDEIGELPLSQQASLLRVLENNEVNRLGGEKAVQVDIRVVAATNLDLLKRVKQGHFRLDLYHRVATLQLQTTPLKARPEDIAPLAKHFLEEMEEELGPRSLTQDSIELLQTYDWPGNVRELRNAVYRAAALCNDKLLDETDFALPSRGKKPAAKLFPDRLNNPVEELSNGTLEELLKEHGCNVTATAAFLKISRTTLRDMLTRRKINIKALRLSAA